MSCLCPAFNFGDYGVTLSATILDDGVALDLTDATEILLWLKPPGAAAYSRELEALDPETDGRIGYTFVAEELETAGTWTYWVAVTFAESRFTTGSGQFQVMPDPAG